ncbi:MAG: hypothetical protein H6825_15320 [Planctomycetes bacterium]|nr:hypothetical protein [Planctomycetota bacterium]
MAHVTRRIGLSLGADLCWPACYEGILRALKPTFAVGPDTISIECERVSIEPYDLRKPTRYDVVLDRVTHWYPTSREWVKKAILLDDVYVLNNPWSIQSMEKQTTYCAMMRLGMPIPDTWMVPPKEYAHEGLPDLQTTLDRYARLFDLGKVGAALGYPMFMKPYDGGAWKGVSRIADEEALKTAYEQSGRLVMHLQKSVEPYEHFVRCVGVGPQVKYIRYDPSAPLHDRYEMTRDFIPEADQQVLRDTTLTINTFFGWDFNSCEALLKDGVWYPIDFANACPDSQVTSLHYHFPWLVAAKLRWSLFCAVTKRPMRKTLDWDPYLRAAEQTEGKPLRERLAAYAAIARERLDVAGFEAFCEKHLPHLDEVVWTFFGSQTAKDAIRAKVTALFPAHEIDEFTELFWSRVQLWREHDAEARAAQARGKSSKAAGAPPATKSASKGGKAR